MSAKHTPGPWKADGYYVRQAGVSGTRMVADVCYTGPHHTPPEEYPKSCRIVDEANARLIAAAPELLEALQEIARLPIASSYPDGPCIERSDMDMVLAAIAKATGEDVQ